LLFWWRLPRPIYFGRLVGLEFINGFLVGVLDGYCYFGGGIYFGRLVGLELINGF
jgi:hypothetical protein